MWQDNAKAPGPSAASGVSLANIWDVRADDSYDVQGQHVGRHTLVAVRTHAGHGRLAFDRIAPIETRAHTLLFLEWQRLRRYRCIGGQWDFWWFEFTVAGTLHFPLHQVLAIDDQPRDAVDFAWIFRALRRETFAQRSLASAGAAMLFYRWLAQWEGERRASPHQPAIERIVDRMHEKLGDHWTVAAMAAEAHLCERRFRQVFQAVTGRSPKRFYDGLRLDRAHELLRLGILSVAEIAEELGFSSPFHFSKAFRRHFGTPPSRVREAEA